MIDLMDERELFRSVEPSKAACTLRLGRQELAAILRYTNICRTNTFELERLLDPPKTTPTPRTDMSLPTKEDLQKDHIGSELDRIIETPQASPDGSLARFHKEVMGHFRANVKFGYLPSTGLRHLRLRGS